MKLRLFRWWFWFYYRLFLLFGFNFVFLFLFLWCLLMMLLLNKGCCGIVNSCFVSLRLIICCIFCWGIFKIGCVVGVCLISGCLCVSVWVWVSYSWRLWRVCLGWMCFGYYWCCVYRSWINICFRCWISGFGCFSCVLSVVGVLFILYIWGWLLWVVGCFGFVSFFVVILSRVVMSLISIVSCLVGCICWWWWWWSILLFCCVVISIFLSRRFLLSISGCISRIWCLNNLFWSLILWWNVVFFSGCRSLNFVSSGFLGCFIIGLYWWILSLGKILGVLVFWRVVIIVVCGYVGWKEKKVCV